MRFLAANHGEGSIPQLTSKGSTLVRRIREEMMANLMKLMAHLTPSENKAWLQIYTKIYDFCQAKHSPNNRWEC